MRYERWPDRQAGDNGQKFFDIGIMVAFLSRELTAKANEAVVAQESIDI